MANVFQLRKRGGGGVRQSLCPSSGLCQSAPVRVGAVGFFHVGESGERLMSLIVEVQAFTSAYLCEKSRGTGCGRRGLASDGISPCKTLIAA